MPRFRPVGPTAATDSRKQRYRAFRPNTFDGPGTIFEHDFGNTMGTNAGGSATSRLRVVVDPEGNMITAFPN